MPTNQEFLSALFGDDAQWAHVTDHNHDPNNIPQGARLGAWMGDYFSRYWFDNNSNQYFTISTFMADEENVARRRKALFRCTHVIVLDDVKEKLSLEQAQKLPPPTWILETSEGSEQWGYKLTVPCTDRHRVDNLLDGLVSEGLAPAGKDPGMKGVTRYVRLPEGYNHKASKLVDGQPFKCNMLSWRPEQTVTMEQMAAPFLIDLDRERREQRVDGAGAVSDHPLLHIPDVIIVKEERSDGRFDITCPWVDEHTEESDDGAAIFTNTDGSIGFKCHHGSCQHRTGAQLLNEIETILPGFRSDLKQWQVRRSFQELVEVPAVTDISFTGEAPAVEGVLIEKATTDEILKEQLNKLKLVEPFSDEGRELSSTLLYSFEGMNAIDQVHWHNQIKDVMHWTKPEMAKILKGLREEWYLRQVTDVGFFNEVIYVRELNQFFDAEKRIFYTPDAYQNAYAHLDDEARKQALQGNMVQKVDRLDYAPLQPKVFERSGISYGNSWSARSEVQGHEGDVSCYLQHFDTIGWGKYRDHVLKYLAYTILHPDKKINHMMIFGSAAEGVGKDWLLYPLVVAMGENHTTIDGEELLSGFSDYMLSTKHLHINEAELGDRREAMQVSAKLKPLAAAPPDTIRVNIKGVTPMRIRNLLSVTMTTNSPMPVRLSSASRRIFALWTDLNINDVDDNMLPEWVEFWKGAWNWMKNGGAEAVINYLRNEVDISDFNPGAVPPVTDFLREIRDASKSPMQQTIEAFITARVGCFAADLVTVGDMSDTLKAGPLVREDLMYCDSKLFTPTRIGCIMRETPGFSPLRAKHKSQQFRLWAVRDSAKYQNMGSPEILSEYESQIKAIRQTAKLKVV